MNHNYYNAVLLKQLKRIFSVFLSALFFLPIANAQESRSNIVTAEWLNQNLKNPDLVIIDASPANAYTAGHIPGAVNYDLFSYGPKEVPLSEVEKRYQAWGISTGKKIIMYDQGGTFLATRLLFSLDYYGFTPAGLFILDGGLSKWKEAGYSVTKEPASPAKGTFTIKQLNKYVRADLPEFLDATGDPIKNAIVEALDAQWHYGGMSPFGKPGHVPNAILLPVEDLYNPDKTFKSNAEIEKILEYKGITPDKAIYSHCGGGIAASVPYFALKYLLGRTDVKLFPGSLLEWAADERELPLWTYDAPYLVRNAGWLQGWGGKMMRMYGISNVTFIDVRTPEEFRTGHVEYAVNLPPDILKNNMHNAGKMQEVLSSAGADPSGEVVLITGGGLTREAALAFAVLEKFGQKKISMFMDPADQWAKSGFKVINDAAELNTSGTSGSSPARQTAYTVNLHNGIIVSSLEGEPGAFPRIILASGRNQPEKAQPGKMIHIPYSDLLNGDGTPKAAKDIWNVLSKSGVPAYAEMVCYSDDPGEAAIGYFILKLMGYPDIKIFVK